MSVDRHEVRQAAIEILSELLHQVRGGSTAGTALAPRDPNPDPDPDQQLALLTVNDVAKLFAVNKDWIYDQAESGALPSIKLGRRQLRFRRSDLEAWLEARQRDSAG